MAVQSAAAASGAVALSNSLRTQYLEDYIDGALGERLYDQIAAPIGKNMAELQRGSSVQVEFLSGMEPGTTAISEVSDVTPQTLRDNTASLTPTSRGEALQCSERLLIQAYTDYGKKLYGRIGQNMMESVDLLAMQAAMKANLVFRPGGVARSALNKTSTGHRATNAIFNQAAEVLQQMRVPGFIDKLNGMKSWVVIMHPAIWQDLLQDGNVVNVGVYQNQSILFNWEYGSMGPFRFVVSPFAKAFWGAGAAEATDPQSTTSAAAVTALATTITATTATHLDNVQWLNVCDTVETGSTLYPKNERVRAISCSGSTVTIIGTGDNGGFKFDHASGITLNNNNSVYTMTMGGPSSLAKVYATEVGEYGQVVGPERTGTLDQWLSIGWKWYGGYGQVADNSLVRWEVSSSADSL